MPSFQDAIDLFVDWVKAQRPKGLTYDVQIVATATEVEIPLGGEPILALTIFNRGAVAVNVRVPYRGRNSTHGAQSTIQVDAGTSVEIDFPERIITSVGLSAPTGSPTVEFTALY